ncbi:NfeD family protein [Nocardioides limicola]|uniref:NfeD family protein n=1 Tax=Nocardioides limicola TaxID=2803368 RepID=UPI00193BFBB8|nr:NfeD family protein [Nocardioides sp. DJM-14]
MTTFLVLGLVGLMLLTVSLVIGDLFDGLFESLEALGDTFSSAVIGGFVSAFGFGGATADAFGLPLLVSLPIATGCGLLFGWFAWWLTRLLRDGSSDGTVNSEDSIGRSGRVVTAIPADGFGVVRVVIGGHTKQFNARAAQPIEPGTEVHVTSILSPTAVTVAPVWGELH